MELINQIYNFLTSLGSQGIALFVTGCVVGAVAAWGFAQKTIVRIAMERIEELSIEVQHLREKVDHLQESRLEIATRDR